MLAPKTTIPTVADAVDRFLATRMRGDWRSYASVLSGPPTGKVTGRAAAGTTLARSELGAQRLDRVTGDQFVAWLYKRHTGLSRSSFKRGKSSLSQFLQFAVARNWADPDVLKPLTLVEAKPSDSRRTWLRPEQVAVLDPLVTPDDFDAAQIMWWRVALDTGVRVEELVELRPLCLQPLDSTLGIYDGAKGEKLRDIPVSTEFCKYWTAYVIEHKLAPGDWMFPLTGQRFQVGGGNERVVLDVKRHADQKAVRSMLARLQEKATDHARRGTFPSELLPSFRLTTHDLRRTYACSSLIMAELLGPGHGLDIRSLQMAMGHASLETTALYLSDVGAYLNRHRRPRGITDVAGDLAEVASRSHDTSLAA